MTCHEGIQVYTAQVAARRQSATIVARKETPEMRVLPNAWRGWGVRKPVVPDQEQQAMNTMLDDIRFAMIPWRTKLGYRYETARKCCEVLSRGESLHAERTSVPIVFTRPTYPKLHEIFMRLLKEAAVSVVGPVFVRYKWTTRNGEFVYFARARGEWDAYTINWRVVAIAVMRPAAAVQSERSVSDALANGWRLDASSASECLREAVEAVGGRFYGVIERCGERLLVANMLGQPNIFWRVQLQV